MDLENELDGVANWRPDEWGFGLLLPLVIFEVVEDDFLLVRAISDVKRDLVGRHHVFSVQVDRESSSIGCSWRRPEIYPAIY